DAPVDGIGIDSLATVVEAADLEAFAGATLRKAVVDTVLRAVEDEHGKRLGREASTARLEPADHLPLGHRKPLEAIFAENAARPCSRGNDEGAGLVAAPLRLHLHAVAHCRPSPHRLVLAHLGAEPAC